MHWQWLNCPWVPIANPHCNETTSVVWLTWVTLGGSPNQAVCTIDCLLADIDNVMLSCQLCQDHLPSHPREPQIWKPKPLHSFQEIAVDYCIYGDKNSWSKRTVALIGLKLFPYTPPYHSFKTNILSYFSIWCSMVWWGSTVYSPCIQKLGHTVELYTWHLITTIPTK